MIARSPCDEVTARAKHCAKPSDSDTGRWVLAATILGSSMVFIDGTVVNVVLPILQADLHASSVDLQWIVVGYTLFLSSLMLVGGSLGDHYGRRRMFSIGVFVFASASIWCGLSQTAGQLIIARAVEGVGSALLTPGSLALIGATFGASERGKAIGTWSSFTAITAALGPAAGGWLAEHASWRWIFFINVPLSIAVLVITLLRVPESADDEKVHRVDWTGAFLGTAGLGGLVYGLTFASALGWTAPSVIAGLAFGFSGLVLFVIFEARSPAPLMPLGLFASRTFSGVNIVTLLLYAALSAVFFFLPFDLIQVRRFTPTAAGLSMFPFIALIFLLSRASGGLVHRYGPRLPLVAGPLIFAVGCGLVGFSGRGGSYWTALFPGICVLGLGMALSVAPLTTVVMESIEANRVGVASAVNNAIARIAGMLAIAAFSIVIVFVFTRGLDERLAAIRPPAPVYAAVMDNRLALAATAAPAGIDPTLRGEIRAAVVDAYLGAFQATMLMCAGLGIASALVAASMIGRK